MTRYISTKRWQYGENSSLARNLRQLSDLLKGTCAWWEALERSTKNAVASAFQGSFRTSAKTDIVDGNYQHEEVYLLVSGWVAKFRNAGAGSRQNVWICLPGDFLNLDTLFVKKPSGGLTCLTDVRTIVLHSDKFYKALCTYPELCHLMASLIAMENAALCEEAARLGGRMARDRLAHFFCEIAVRLGQAENPSAGGFDFPLTQEQLADVLGLTSVHINRKLGDLRADGIIAHRANRLEILDWDRLKSMAAFDESYLRMSPRTYLPDLTIKMPI